MVVKSNWPAAFAALFACAGTASVYAASGGVPALPSTEGPTIGTVTGQQAIAATLAEPGDNCDAPLLITLPGDLPYTNNNYTCGRLNDYAETGLGSYDGGEDIVYEVTVTEDVLVDIILDPMDTTWTGIGLFGECPPGATALAISTSSSAIPHGIDCYLLTPGTYYIMIDTWPSPDCIPNFDLDIVTCEPCVLECPPGSTLEAEECGDDTNGGCNMDVPAFEPLNCGKTICGTLWASTELRDTDWYEVTVLEPTTFTWTVEAELPIAMGLVEPIVPGVADCTNTTGSLNPFATAEDCEVASVTTECLPPGTYWFFVAPLNFADTPCGTFNTYIASLECVSCTIPFGACCLYSGECIDEIYEDACIAEGGVYQGDFTVCDQVDCPLPGLGDSCDTPIVIEFAGEYTDTNFTCGRQNFYSETCLGYYDGGEDIIYELNIVEPVALDIMLDPMGTTWTGIGLFDGCPDVGGCIDFDTLSSAEIHGLECVTLFPGVYYIMIDTWPSPDCIPEFTLTISECIPPIGACCVDGECVGDLTEIECYGDMPKRDTRDTMWFEGETCAGFICPGQCPDATINIHIFTDNYPEETSWQLEVKDTGEIVDTGGPYDASLEGVLIIEEVCVDFDECYRFIIFDSYGDGIFSPGYWEVYYEGELQAFNYDFGGDVDEGLVGVGCFIPTGACCIGGECFILTEEDCLDQGGDYLGDGTNCGGNVVGDGGFEAGVGGGTWAEDSLNFGTPICDLGACGTGTGTGPFNGDYWAWFGGISAYEYGSVTQDLVIPTDATTMTFWLEQYVCDSADDYVEVSIDGDVLFVSTGGDALCGVFGYTQQAVDISAYADGGVHTLTFYSEIFATNGGGSNFFVDDVEILAGGPCDETCGDLDGDFDVDDDDLALLLDSYGSCDGDAHFNPDADYDGDGCIGLVDYGIWYQCWSEFGGVGDKK
jgi:hypothetical protein